LEIQLQWGTKKKRHNVVHTDGPAAMVMLTTSKTTTSWMFAVLAYTSVTG
jgi:hypothetical protein